MGRRIMRKIQYVGCWRYDYIIELDVKGLFDYIDHELLMRVVEIHVKEAWASVHIKR